MASTRRAASQAATAMLTATRSSKPSSKSSKEVVRTKSSECPPTATAAVANTANSSQCGKLKDQSETSSSSGAVPHSQADKRRAAKCAVCDAKIVDGKDEALYCEGLCQRWMHRYCAGVSLVHFERLAASTEARYECATCIHESQAKRVHALEDAVAALQVEVTELHKAISSFHKFQPLEEEVKTLSSEVTKIRDSCEGLSKVVCSSSHLNQQSAALNSYHQNCGDDFKQPNHSSSESLLPQGGRGGRRGNGRGGNVVGGRGRGRGRGRGVGRGQANVAAKPGGDGVPDKQSNDITRECDESRKPRRVRINGARKVWGTLRATTAVTVKNAIVSITKIPVEHFVVKRKYRLNFTTKSVSKWWFVIRGEEEVLKTLEAKWPSVLLQTTWKLEDVCAYTELTSHQVESHSPAADLSTPSNNASHGLSERSNAASQCSASDNEQMSSQDVSLDATPLPSNAVSHCSANDSATISPQQEGETTSHVTLQPHDVTKHGTPPSDCILQPPLHSNLSFRLPTLPSSEPNSQSDSSPPVPSTTDSFLDVLAGPLVQLEQ